MNFQQLLDYKFNRRLKIGDICIWQNLTGEHAGLNGTETTIVEVYGNWMWLTDTRLDGKRCVAGPYELRKKCPLRRAIDAKVSWADCLWRPLPPRIETNSRARARGMKG